MNQSSEETVRQIAEQQKRREALQEAMKGVTCQVCGAEPAVGVASSALMPMSLAFGINCLQHHAEAEQTLIYCLWNNQGDGEINPEVSSWLTTYKDGRYLTWDQWFQEYGSKLDLETLIGKYEGGENGETDDEFP